MEEVSRNTKQVLGGQKGGSFGSRREKSLGEVMEQDFQHVSNHLLAKEMKEGIGPGCV